MIGFVYRWECQDGRWYIGSHKGNTNDGYVSSSTVLNNEDLTKWTREILAEGPIEEMRELEITLLKSLNAVNDPQSLNQAYEAGSVINFKEVKTATNPLARSPEVKYMLQLIGEI